MTRRGGDPACWRPSSSTDCATSRRGAIVSEHGGELFSAIAGDGITRSADQCWTFLRPSSSDIAGRMTVDIVERLEVIISIIREREEGVHGAAPFLLQHQIEKTPVWNAGEFVKDR